MDSNYPAIMRETCRWEGGYVNHPKDPGGATNMGITQRTMDSELPYVKGLPVHVRDISQSQAADIYRRSYWLPVRGPQLPSGLDHVAFDGAVNSGVSRGAKWLQVSLGVKADGVIGPNTIAAARLAYIPDVVTRACDTRRGFLRGLRIFDTFGKGWMRRVDGVEAHSLRLAGANMTAAAAAANRRSDANLTKGGAVGVTGGSGTGVSEYLDALPADWVVYVAGAAVAVIALNLIGRAVSDRRRAKAIAEEAAR